MTNFHCYKFLSSFLGKEYLVSFPWCRCTSVNLECCVFIAFKRMFYASSHTFKALSDRRVKHTSYEHQLRTALMLKLAHSAFALQCQLALWCFPKGPFLFSSPMHSTAVAYSRPGLLRTLHSVYLMQLFVFFSPCSSNCALKQLISSPVFLLSYLLSC